MSLADYRKHLLLYMALKEATASMGEELHDVDVEGADLPPELESKIQAALNGHATELSPEDREFLMGFMIPPDSADGFRIADASDRTQLGDATQARRSAITGK